MKKLFAASLVATLLAAPAAFALEWPATQPIKGQEGPGIRYSEPIQGIEGPDARFSGGVPPVRGLEGPDVRFGDTPQP